MSSAKPIDPAPAPECPKGLVHRGFFHERTAYDQAYRNNRRETALAQAWEAENAHTGAGHHICSATGRRGLLDSLMTHERIQVVGPSGYAREERVGVYDQNAAQVAATVVQWLGSNIGFDFLANALADAGYDVVERESGRAVPVVKR